MSRCILTPLFILAAFTTVSAHDECLIDPPEGVSTVPRGSVKVGKMVTAFCMGKGRVPYDIVQLPCEEHAIIDTSDYPVCRADVAEGRCSLNPPHGVGIYPKVDSIRVGDSLIVYCKEGPVQKGLVDCTSTGSITEEDYPVCVEEEVHMGAFRGKSRRKKKKGSKRKTSRRRKKLGTRFTKSKSRRRKPVVSNYEEKVTPSYNVVYDVETEEGIDKMIMEDKSMMMEDKPWKVTENTYEQNPAGLKLTVTDKQFENMWIEGYFEGSVAKAVGMNKNNLNGGFCIQLNKTNELMFLVCVEEEVHMGAFRGKSRRKKKKGSKRKTSRRRKKGGTRFKKKSKSRKRKPVVSNYEEKVTPSYNVVGKKPPAVISISNPYPYPALNSAFDFFKQLNKKKEKPLPKVENKMSEAEDCEEDGSDLLDDTLDETKKEEMGTEEQEEGDFGDLLDDLFDDLLDEI